MIKRKLRAASLALLSTLFLIACGTLGAVRAKAECSPQVGPGDNLHCLTGGNCGNIGSSNLPYFCITEICKATASQIDYENCWPGVAITCVFGGCVNFISGNCIGCQGDI